MSSILRAENIEFGYLRSAPLLKNFSLEIPQGRMLAVIGPNGAGKSTVLKLLSGYLHPSDGRVSLKDEDINKVSNKTRSRIIAVVGQNVLSPLPFTVRQVVEMGRSARVPRFSPFSKADAMAVIDAMLEMDIETFADKMFNALSGGEKQRVKIAAALAQDPEVLLLDEPTSQLDMGHAVRLMLHLKRVNFERNTSVVVVSHDIQLLSGFMRDFVLMRNGEVVASGEQAKVLTPTLVREAYECEVEMLNSSTGGVVIVPKVGNAISQEK